MDHMIPVPKDLTVDKAFLYECDELEFREGLSELTDIVYNVYSDMRANPDDYGLPLVEISIHGGFTDEARASKNSCKRLVTLLFILGKTGIFQNNELSIKIQEFTQANKSLKGKDRVLKPLVVLNKLLDFGFHITGFNGKSFNKGIDTLFLSYPDDSKVIKALKGYMMAGTISDDLYAMQPYFVIPKKQLPEDQYYITFYSYLREQDQPVLKEFHRLMLQKNYICKDAKSYSYMLEYFRDCDITNYAVRCLSEDKRLEICLKLRNVDRYTSEILEMPQQIQKVFKTTNCYYCNSKGDRDNSVSCHYRVEWTLEDQNYAVCACNFYFKFMDTKVEDLNYLMRLLQLDKTAV